MPLTQGEYTISTHGLFFPAGKAFTVPGAGTCGRQAKPGASDPAWINLGQIKVSKDKQESTKIDRWASVPGRRVLYNRKRVKRILTHKLTLQEFSPLIAQLLFGTLPLDGASTQFNAGSGADVQGWLKLQRYDDATGGLRIILEHFVDLELTNELDFTGEEFVDADIEATVLHSTLNTGSL